MNAWMRAAAVLTCAWLAVAGPAQAQAKRPNILLVVADDQRFDLMSCAGHPILKTPNVDRLAKAGTRFKNMFATTPICAASRASIFTGMYERTHKFTFGTPPIAAPFCDVSYPLVLRRAGYRTGLIGKFGVGVAAGKEGEMFDTLVKIGYPYLRKEGDGIRHIDQIATDKAIDFLRTQPKDRPFCLSISFNSPHAEDGKLDALYPWPKSVDGWYDDVAIPDPPLVAQKHFDAHPKFLQEAMGRIRWRWQFDTPEKYVKNVRSYYRMISGIDHELGRIFAELEKLGIADDTIVIYTADNGYFLGERGLSGKWVHYEESLRVPLVIRDPRTPADKRGQTRDELVLNLDLASTILDLAGLAVPKEHQGKSVAPLVRGERPTWRTDFFCEHLMVNPALPKWEGVRDARYVYARYFDQKPPYEYLHDLASDPQELTNLATSPASAELLARMRARCDELREAWGGPYSPERFPTTKGAKKKAK